MCMSFRLVLTNYDGSKRREQWRRVIPTCGDLAMKLIRWMMLRDYSRTKPMLSGPAIVSCVILLGGILLGLSHSQKELGVHKTGNGFSSPTCWLPPKMRSNQKKRTCFRQTNRNLAPVTPQTLVTQQRRLIPPTEMGGINYKGSLIVRERYMSTISELMAVLACFGLDEQRKFLLGWDPVECGKLYNFSLVAMPCR